MKAKPNSVRRLSSSMEDYLEAVALLKKDKGVARVRDISRLLQVKTPSVSGALSSLSKKGLLIHERYGYVNLTPRGERLADDIQRRHGMLIRFLTEVLGIDRATATKDACRMEHSISPQTFRKFTKFMESTDDE
ncbi:metal-dependent transcriptional regulator [Candidatus Omnitrophota bacterium]